MSVSVSMIVTVSVCLYRDMRGVSAIVIVIVIVSACRRA